MTAINRALITHWFACLDRHDLDRAAALLAPSWRMHGLAPYPLSVDGWIRALDAIFDAFPDGCFIIRDTVAEGDRVAVRHTFGGTHLAPFRGIPPTGIKVAVEGTVVAQVENGLIQQAWHNLDCLGLLRQLGVVASV